MGEAIADMIHPLARDLAHGLAQVRPLFDRAGQRGVQRGIVQLDRDVDAAGHQYPASPSG
ncbi:hypothetical protein [Sphingobium abikonense]|uniref:hypothetical protein n=1 Tax=Sphingobium abikonense TaxID=86193 RepID=UPI003511ECA7